MDAKLILIIAGVGLACFVLGLLVRGGGRRDEGMMVRRSSPPPGPNPPTNETHSSYGGDATNAGITLQLGRELEALLSAGKKIEAIKVVRERTGLGLKESKDAVERLEHLMKRMN